jgi:CO/xanthine dehydrogenase FAD-binding subunit
MVEALRLAVRLLHAGLRDVDVRGLLPRRPDASRGGRRPAQRQPVPLHGLPPDPRRGRRAAKARARPGSLPDPPAARGPSRRPRRRDLRGPGQRFVRPDHAGRAGDAAGELPRRSWWRARRRSASTINKKGSRFPSADLDRGRRRADAPSSGDRDALVVGGAATLTALEEASAASCPSLQKMLLVFASRQIRNRATLAGNLVTASPIGDMAPVLLSLDAGHAARARRRAHEVPLAEFFTGYRKTVLAADEVMRNDRHPARGADAGGRRLDRATRSPSAASSTSASWRRLRGRRSTPTAWSRTRAGLRRRRGDPSPRPKTEAFLVGKPWTEATVRAAQAVLAAEFSPIDDVRSGVAFRRGSSSSLLREVLLGRESEAQDAPLDFAPGATPGPRPVRASELRHESAVGHVTGTRSTSTTRPSGADARAVAGDCPPRARAPRPRRRRPRAAMPGVVACSRPRHPRHQRRRRRPPRRAAAGPRRGPLPRPHGRRRRRRVGRRARRPRRRRGRLRAAPRAVLGLRRPSRRSFHTQPHVIRRGDAPPRSAAPPPALGRARDRRAGALLPRVAGRLGRVRRRRRRVRRLVDAAPVRGAGRGVARAGVPAEPVVVQAPRMGGGFGGKETQGNSWAALVALAARGSPAPVRVQLDRDVDMTLTGKRHPFHATFEVGFDDAGKLPGARGPGLRRRLGPRPLRVDLRPRALPPRQRVLPAGREVVGPRRQHQHRLAHRLPRLRRPQGMVVIEEIMDRIARHLGLPARGGARAQPLPRRRARQAPRTTASARAQPPAASVGRACSEASAAGRRAPRRGRALQREERATSSAASRSRR